MFKSVVLTVLLGLAACTLQVYGPPCAKLRVSKSIEYSLSNFGEIPYTQTIIGQLVTPINEELCQETGEVFIHSKDPPTKVVFLVKRGGCKFTKKVINAQNLGADLIIIYDHLDSDKPSVIMKNDGHGHLAEIPSLFISKTDGENLRASDASCPRTLVRVHFEMDQLETSEVTLWLDAGNRETYILARDFHKKDYYDVLKDKMTLSVRFRIENNCSSWICSKDDCVGTLKERYCRNVQKPDNPDVPFTKGADLIQEQLREHFLWENIQKTTDRELWWRYMAKFDHNDCITDNDVEDCSFTTMRELELEESIIAAVKSDAEGAIAKITEGKGKSNILKEAYEESKEAGIYFYPEVTINGRNFYGLFKAPEVFEAICDSLLDPPDKCISFINENHEEDFRDETGGLWKTILVILVVMTLGFIVALFVYTKVIKREVNQQMSLEVNKMVEKYVNLGSKKGDATGQSYSKFDS